MKPTRLRPSQGGAFHAPVGPSGLVAINFTEGDVAGVRAAHTAQVAAGLDATSSAESRAAYDVTLRQLYAERFARRAHQANVAKLAHCMGLPDGAGLNEIGAEIQRYPPWNGGAVPDRALRKSVDDAVGALDDAMAKIRLLNMANEAQSKLLAGLREKNKTLIETNVALRTELHKALAALDRTGVTPPGVTSPPAPSPDVFNGGMFDTSLRHLAKVAYFGMNPHPLASPPQAAPAFPPGTRVVVVCAAYYDRHGEVIHHPGAALAAGPGHRYVQLDGDPLASSGYGAGLFALADLAPEPDHGDSP